MTPEDAQHLGALIRARRVKLGLKAREVARQAGVDVATVSRLEQGHISGPRPDNLTAIGEVLGIPAADLFAVADWVPRNELPAFQPYMRAKFHELPDQAIERLQDFLDQMQEEYGHDGPANGEDEHLGPHAAKR